jgi:serine/threonine-protein kinase HipA
VSRIELVLGDVLVGELHRHPGRDGESVSFRYSEDWLEAPTGFALDPELHLDARTSSPARGGLFGALSDSGPDRWGRQLVQRRERRAAEAEGRAVRSLSELDYVLGVSDRARLGALRFRIDDEFVARGDEVPPLVRLGALLGAADRLARDEESAEDLALLLAPGSSLGGARPKASVLDARGRLAIAKLPRETDEYPIERWEWVALELARAAGIRVPEAELLTVAGRPVLLARRFDRHGAERIHFASALTLLALRDGDRASYPEIAEILQREGSQPRRDGQELFRRMLLNICIANVDDHLRNLGFLREPAGWTLSPVYDLNPVPADVRPRILTTSITLDDATGSLDAARESATYFGLSPRDAEAEIERVLRAVAGWETVARAAGASAKECARMRSAFLTRT